MKCNLRINNKYRTTLLLLLCFLLLTSCQNAAALGKSGEVSVINVSSFLTDSGILYDDMKAYPYKCYFDYQNNKNVYFCSRPNCNHSSIDCLSKQVQPYSFLIGSELYYIVTQREVYKDSTQAVLSYLYQSDIQNTKAKIVAKLEGSIVSDMFLMDNRLTMLLSKPEIVKGKVASVRYYVNQIDMTYYKNKEILLSIGTNEDYIPSGFIENKLILYHRYFDKVINPADYGLKGEQKDFIKDTKNYKKYMQEVMKFFHEEMLYVDFDSSELVPLDLPTPLLIHNNTYYYNKISPEGIYQLISHNLLSKEEEVLYDGPVISASVVRDTLFFKEGIVKESEVTFLPTIDYDRNLCKEYSYNLITKEQKEVIDHLPEEATMELISESEDYYIFYYRNLQEGIQRRIGYITKENYYSGKDQFTLVTPQ